MDAGWWITEAVVEAERARPMDSLLRGSRARTLGGGTDRRRVVLAGADGSGGLARRQGCLRDQTLLCRPLHCTTDSSARANDTTPPLSALPALIRRHLRRAEAAPAPSRSPNTCVPAELTHYASPILVPRCQTQTACLRAAA